MDWLNVLGMPSLLPSTGKANMGSEVKENIKNGTANVCVNLPQVTLAFHSQEKVSYPEISRNKWRFLTMKVNPRGRAIAQRVGVLPCTQPTLRHPNIVLSLPGVIQISLPQKGENRLKKKRQIEIKT